MLLSASLLALTCIPHPTAQDGDIEQRVEAQVRSAVGAESGMIGYAKAELRQRAAHGLAPVFEDWASDAFAFERGARVQGESLGAARSMEALFEEAWCAAGFEVAASVEQLSPASPAELPHSLPDDAARALAEFLATMPANSRSWMKAIEGIPSTEEALGARAMRYFSGGSTAEVRALLDGFDRAEAGRAGLGFVAATERLARELARVEFPTDFEEVRVSTAFGDIRIGCMGDSEHAPEDLLLLVDLTGDDRYLPGTARAGDDLPFCAVIDLSGRDVYSSKNDPALAGAGAGIAGNGILIDLAGDDRYEVESLGAGFAAMGSGVLHDVAGDDVYVGTQTCQAVGFAGVGVIFDEAGNDRYELFTYGQGLGHPLGCGLISDLSGDDLYLARDDELRSPSPQTAEHNVSMAQGCGLGWRDDGGERSGAGGIGIVLDHSGDDTYRGGVFAQATAYWYGIGMLLDLDGADTYEAVYYGQSACAHFALTYFRDVRGDDHYKTTLSQALGNGRDFSLAIFRDDAGSDSYFAPDRSLGCGDLNGTGLFVDLDGEDAYEFQTAVNGANTNFPGAEASEIRQNAATVGIFLDLGGDADEYGREGLTNDGTWNSTGHFRGMKAFGLDDGPK